MESAARKMKAWIFPSAAWMRIPLRDEKKFILNYLDENPDTVLNFGLIYGIASQTEQLKRNQDVLELAERCRTVKVLDSQYADWSTDKATNITEDWLMRYPEMNAVPLHPMI